MQVTINIFLFSFHINNQQPSHLCPVCVFLSPTWNISSEDVKIHCPMIQTCISEHSKYYLPINCKIFDILNALYCRVNEITKLKGHQNIDNLARGISLFDLAFHRDHRLRPKRNLWTQIRS